VLAGGLIAAACSSAFRGVASLEGGLGSRESDGAIMLVILLGLMAVAGFIAVRFARGESDKDERELLGSRPRMALAGSVVALVLIGLVIGGLQEKASSADLAQANASRLTSVSSNRYEYWRVGARAFAHHPLDGLGAAGFHTYWLEHRRIQESVQAVHSIELEMAAELGLIGLLAFGTMIGGVGWAAARGVRGDPTVTAGWMAASLVWLLHASIDWDWELPAVSLPAIVLAGAMIAAAERGPDLWRPSS
jgi:O-antigen ligase